MNLNDFDFLLPEKLIALRPVRPRTSSRLLVVNSGSFVDTNFFQLKSFYDQVTDWSLIIQKF